MTFFETPEAKRRRVTDEELTDKADDSPSQQLRTLILFPEDTCYQKVSPFQYSGRETYLVAEGVDLVSFEQLRKLNPDFRNRTFFLIAGKVYLTSVPSAVHVQGGIYFSNLIYYYSETHAEPHNFTVSSTGATIIKYGNNNWTEVDFGSRCEGPNLRLAGGILYSVRLSHGYARAQSWLAAGAPAVVMVEIKYPWDMIEPAIGDADQTRGYNLADGRCVFYYYDSDK